MKITIKSELGHATEYQTIDIPCLWQEDIQKE